MENNNTTEKVNQLSPVAQVNQNISSRSLSVEQPDGKVEVVAHYSFTSEGGEIPLCARVFLDLKLVKEFMTVAIERDLKNQLVYWEGKNRPVTLPERETIFKGLIDEELVVSALLKANASSAA